MHRATSIALLLALLTPAFGPLALAQIGAAEPMHCQRRPLETRPAAAPAMQCHHGMAGAAPDARRGSSETSFRSLDCCANHDCCRGVKTSNWARPAAALLAVVSLVIQPAPQPAPHSRLSTFLAGADSARAPPVV